jgi:signal transduction histidine kinase
MLGTLEMVVDEDFGPLSEEQRRFLSDAQQRGNDALELIGDLLELTLLEEERLVPALAPLESSAVLETVVDAWSVRAERRGASLTVQEADRVELHADEHLLQRVFANLIGNALRHAGKGVHIRLAARRSADGDGVHFTVADDGVGIPPAYHDLIFRKFGSVQGPSARSSPGLGLTFCKLAVEAHGGRIWVESPEGKGSAFSFVIPRRAGVLPARELALEA